MSVLSTDHRWYNMFRLYFVKMVTSFKITRRNYRYSGLRPMCNLKGPIGTFLKLRF